MKGAKLILLGGGGHCKSVIEVANESGYEIVGILDKPENIGKTICGYDIIGSDDQIPNYVSTCLFIVTVGQIKNPAIRIKLYNLILQNGGKIATMISNSAYCSKYSRIGSGTIIMNQALVNSDVIIGKNCIINSKALIEHDAVIGDHTHISTGVVINGGCIVGNNCFIGSGCLLSNNVEIPDNTIIGIGSLVINSIKKPGTYFGNPIKKQ